MNNSGVVTVAANDLEPLGLRYLEVGAHSLEQSVAFYVDLLGFSTMSAPVEQPDSRVQWVASGSIQLQIVEVGRDATPGDWRNDDTCRGGFGTSGSKSATSTPGAIGSWLPVSSSSLSQPTF